MEWFDTITDRLPFKTYINIHTLNTLSDTSRLVFASTESLRKMSLGDSCLSRVAFAERVFLMS